jgi:branched-chain amino acid transport system permease protein
VLAPIEEGFTLLGFQIPPFLGFTTILLGVLFIIVLIEKPEGIMGEKELSFKAISRILKIND